MENISYDRENDLLYLNNGEKVQDSLDIGNIFLEFSGKNEVVGAEILKASQTVSELTGHEITPENLENVEEAEIKVVSDDKIVLIVVKMEIAKDKRITEESININLSSEALA